MKRALLLCVAGVVLVAGAAVVRQRSHQSFLRSQKAYREYQARQTRREQAIAGLA